MSLFLILLASFIGLNLAYFHDWLWLCIAIFWLVLLLFLVKKKKIVAPLCSFFLAIAMMSILQSLPTDKEQIVGVVYESRENYFLLNNGLNRYYIQNKEEQYEKGMILSITGYDRDFTFIVLESQFDFGDYLLKKGVKKEFVAQTVTIHWTPLISTTALKNKFLASFDQKSQQYLSSVLFLDFDDHLYGQFDNLGIAYLLGALGLYGTILKNFIKGILARFFTNQKVITMLTLVFLWIYFSFLPTKLFVWRLTILSVLTLCNFGPKRKIAYHNALSFSGIVILLCDPYFALQTSFIYSYFILFLIIIIRKIKLFRSPFCNKLLKTVFFYSGLYLMLRTANYEMNLLFPFLQVFLSPIFCLLFIVGIFSFFIFPCPTIIHQLIRVLDFLMAMSQKIKINIVIGEMSTIVLIILAGLFLISLFLARIKLKKETIIAFLLFGCFCLGENLPIAHYSTAEIAFINIGQGDAIFIRNNTHAMLVDTGGNFKIDLANECLIPFLKKRKVRYLEYLLITHDDFDHSGAIDSLLSNFSVSKIITDQKELPIFLGKMKIVNLNNYLEEDKDNDKSLVLYFTLAKKNFLLMGDLEKKGEQKIMSTYQNLAVDYLKIGHHGSNTSSSLSFLQFINPKYAIISVGKNSYGHPHQEVINNLKALNIRYFRTDENGTIRFIFSSFL